MQVADANWRGRLEALAQHVQSIRTFGCKDDLQEAGAAGHGLAIRAAIEVWLGRDEAEHQEQIDWRMEVARAGCAGMAIVGSVGNPA